MIRILAVAMAGAAMLANIGGMAQAASGTITQKPFGTAPDGQAVTLYTLTNPKGMQVSIMNYGGIVQSLLVPDKTGKLGDIVLGYDTLDQYVANSPYFGAIVGRYANRIARGRFTLDGKTHQLAINNGVNSLHGGKVGFDKVVWTATPLPSKPNGAVGLRLHYLSKDGEENYPGNLSVDVTYTLAADNTLSLDYKATTDQDTVVNLSSHVYWNLNGQASGSILNQAAYINADKFTPTDATQIPTGELAPVAETPFDFRAPTEIGAHINDANPQLAAGMGYDHNWVLNKSRHGLTKAAEFSSTVSGRTITVYTDQPGLQFYSGNFLDGTLTGKNSAVYQKHAAFVFEAQHFPDSPNQPSFPTTELKPGQTYTQHTVYNFGLLL